MSVRQALLALLEQGPMYGYQLRAEFEQRTGATWPLNVGQVYTTLTRLERDGLVESAEADEAADQGAAQGASHGAIYRVTPAGRDEVAAWFTTPVPRTQPPRDELAIKLAIAVTVPGVDVGRVIQQQRSATMAALQDYTRLKRGGRAAAPDGAAPTWPGAWCSTRWSSAPRPRSAGWTTASPGSAAPPPSAPRRESGVEPVETTRPAGTKESRR